MKKVSFIISLATVLSVFSVSASAASLDFREEYKHGKDEESRQAGRIKISAGSGNHFFGLELKHDGRLSELKAGDEEFEYGYKYDITDKIAVAPGVVITLNNKGTTYKPQARLFYSFENGITTKLRYRHEFRKYDSVDNYSKGRDGVKRGNFNRSKITGNILYKWKAVSFDFETNYAEDFINKKWSMGVKSKKKNEWDYNLTMGYVNSTNWTPYIELGNVGCKTCGGDHRQLRSRIGVSYKF